MLGEIDSVVGECTVWIGQTLKKARRSKALKNGTCWAVRCSQINRNRDFALQGWKLVRKLVDALKKQRVTVK